jgi:hypothetical protein
MGDYSKTIYGDDLMLKKDKEKESKGIDWQPPEPTIWDDINRLLYSLSPFRFYRRHPVLGPVLLTIFCYWFLFIWMGFPSPFVGLMNVTAVPQDYTQTHYTNGEYTFDTVYEKDVPDYLSQKNMPREQLMSIDCDKQLCSIVFKN